MNNKELLIDFIEYAKSRHVMPILHSNIEPLVDDYLRQQNLQQCSVSSSADVDDKPLTQCMVGRDTECNHPKCPVTDEDAKAGRYCTLPLYDWRE